MPTLGVYVEAGGNQVFFANGALAVLREQSDIRIDTLIGLSSSSPVILAFFIGRNRETARLFADKLDANQRNFYLLRSPHFPHDEIYRSVVRSLIDEYVARGRQGTYVLLGTQSEPSFVRAKAFCASVLLAIRHTIGIDLVPNFKKLAGVGDVRLSMADALSAQELTNFVMGTSSIYPFVRPRVLRGRAILEGALSSEKKADLLAEYDKKMVIHNEKGVSGLVDGVYHLFATDTIPQNMLDYTKGAPVRELHAAGEADMHKNMADLRSYLGFGPHFPPGGK